MPSEKTIAKKKQIVEALVSKIAEATAGVVVDYKGITVEEDTKLRAEMREANVEYFVAKNTLLKLATKDTELAGLSEVLEGTTSVAVCKNDYVAAAKIVAKYAEELGERFNIKAGFADGKVLSVAEVNAFAKLHYGIVWTDNHVHLCCKYEGIRLYSAGVGAACRGQARHLLSPCPLRDRKQVRKDRRTDRPQMEHAAWCFNSAEVCSCGAYGAEYRHLGLHTFRRGYAEDRRT